MDASRATNHPRYRLSAACADAPHRDEGLPTVSSHSKTLVVEGNSAKAFVDVRTPGGLLHTCLRDAPRSVQRHGSATNRDPQQCVQHETMPNNHIVVNPTVQYPTSLVLRPYSSSKLLPPHPPRIFDGGPVVVSVDHVRTPRAIGAPRPIGG